MKQTMKAWLRAWMRPSALAMAVMIVISTLPLPAPLASAVSQFSPVVEAYAATAPAITFEADDPYSGYVITGQNIEIKEVYDNGIFMSDGISISIGEGFVITSKNAAENGVTITLDEQKSNRVGNLVTNYYILNFDKNFDPQPKSGESYLKTEADAIYKEPKSASFIIDGVYNATLKEGIATEKYESETRAGTATVGRINDPQTLTIMMTSRITLECTSSEMNDDGSNLAFKVAAATGSLSDYLGGSVSVGDIITTGGKKQVEVLVSPPSTSTSTRGSSWFTLTPVITHFDVDEEGNQLTTTNKNILEKTTFDIFFEVPTAQDQRLLKVMTPQAAMEEIENLIYSSDGTTNQNFIRLATGETTDYIENPFDLRYTYNRYRSTFRIDWRWFPKEIRGEDGYGPMTDADKTKAKAFMNPPTLSNNTNGEWEPSGLKTAESQRLEDDVKGYLIPTVYYVPNSQWSSRALEVKEAGPSAYTEEDVETFQGKQGYPIKEIIVKGTGQKPTVAIIGKAEVDKNNPGIENPDIVVTGEDALIPKTTRVVPMDAYLGGISPSDLGVTLDSYPFTPKGPFSYRLRLGMGVKNSASRIARVDVNCDPSILTFNTNKGEPTVTPTAGGFYFEIENEHYERNGNNVILDEQELTFTLNPREPDTRWPSSILLTFTFYKLNAAGQEIENENKYYLQISPVSDTTPSRDNRLQALQIVAQDGTVNGEVLNGSKYNYIFDKDTREYNITVPFRYYAITLYPNMLDNNALQYSDMYLRMDNGLGIEQSMPGMVSGQAKNGKKSAEFGYVLPKNGGFIVPLYNGEWGNETQRVDPQNEMVGYTYSLTLTTPARDPRSQFWTPPYTINITRAKPSNDNTLSYIGLYLEEADPDDPNNNLITNFDPRQDTYDIYVPYSTHNLRVRYQLNDPMSVGPEFKVTGFRDSGTEYNLEPYNSSTTTKEWLKEVKEHFKLTDANGMLVLNFTVTSEEGYVTGNNGKKVYQVRLHQMDPNNDPNASGIGITTGGDREVTYTPRFSPDNDTYRTEEIPYSDKQIKFTITANDPNVYKVEIWEGEISIAGNEVKEGVGAKLKAKYISGGDLTNEEEAAGVLPIRLGAATKGLDVIDISQTTNEMIRRNGYHPFNVVIWAENENTVTSYLYCVYRMEPSTDTQMDNLIMKDQSNQNIDTFLFLPNQYGPDGAYHVKVPFSTTGVSFTPTTRHPYATVKIYEELLGNTMRPFPLELESGATSRVYNLKNPPEEKQFRVEITAEDGVTKRVYYIFVSREPPSDDARLKALEAQNTHDFKPIFIARQTAYTAILNEGAPGTIIIATANHPGATIRVEGMVVQSGQPSPLIELLDITTTIHVEVIAEDGVTRMVYTITITNENLIEKTSNADLRDLTVNYGLMTPEFQAAVTDYEVTTKETAWSVDIIPKPADPLATMRVLNGTRELGDYNGNYAMAIVDGQNDVSVEVTSPDGTVTKTYAVAIFRNDEEKLKNLKPLEAEDINFEQVSNPIIVKIEEYPRVGASVFNTLREEYPDYSIVFQGNDYSLRFDAKNLTRVIPQTEIYDFRMTYASPQEDEIYDLIAEYEYNDDIIDDVVMPYFDYHGSLPGPATFSLSLGRAYGNDLLYWHYYNMERERIDYYGTLQSNSQGTIAVSIDHFSTYVVSPEHRIAGSEDKDGIIDELGMVSNGQDLLGSGGKLNPNTGVEEGP